MAFVAGKAERSLMANCMIVRYMCSIHLSLRLYRKACIQKMPCKAETGTGLGTINTVLQHSATDCNGNKIDFRLD
jgi:hypothetical protein